MYTQLVTFSSAICGRGGPLYLGSSPVGDSPSFDRSSRPVAPDLTIFRFIVLTIFNDAVPSAFGGANFASNAAVCNLDRRLHFRAVSNALSSLVHSFEGGPDNSSLPAKKAEEDQYAELLPLIFAKWNGNRSFTVLIAGGFLLIGTEVVCFIINVALGSCVPAGVIGMMATASYIILVELVEHVDLQQPD